MNPMHSVIIFEADTGKDLDMVRWLRDKEIANKRGYGSYHDVVNPCFMVKEEHLKDIWQCEFIARQESILHVDKDGNASLIYLNGTVHEPEPIGTWQKMAEKDALKRPGWTYLPKNAGRLGDYYVAE